MNWFPTEISTRKTTELVRENNVDVCARLFCRCSLQVERTAAVERRIVVTTISKPAESVGCDRICDQIRVGCGERPVHCVGLPARKKPLLLGRTLEETATRTAWSVRCCGSECAASGLSPLRRVVSADSSKVLLSVAFGSSG